MTIERVLKYASDVKPHAFSDDTLMAWLNECEGHIQTEILCIDPEDIIVYDENDMEKELIIAPPHDKLYGMYLIAMIDFANGEYSKYENSMSLYNAALDEYAKWFVRTHTRCPDISTRGYYISAYGIAKKHGFEGTEEEWLLSLKGDRGEQGIQGIQGIQGVAGNVSDVTESDRFGCFKATVGGVEQDIEVISEEDIVNTEMVTGINAMLAVQGNSIGILNDMVEATFNELDNKVDKVDGKGLSSNDYTDEDKEKLDGLENYDDSEVKGLIAQNAAAISEKVDKEDGKGLSTNDFTDKEKYKLGELPDSPTLAGEFNYLHSRINGKGTSRVYDTYEEMCNDLYMNTDVAISMNPNCLPIGANIYIRKLNVPDLWVSGYLDGDDYEILPGMKTEIEILYELDTVGYVDIFPFRLSALETQKVDLSEYVEKEEGKNLSSNDFTDEYMEKLDGLENYDDSEVKGLIAQKAQKANNYTGFEGGFSADAKKGAAVGSCARAESGGAVGYNALTSSGFAGGMNAITGNYSYETNRIEPIDAIQLGYGRNESEKTLQVYDKQIVSYDETERNIENKWYLKDVGKISELNTSVNTSVVNAINSLVENKVYTKTENVNVNTIYQMGYMPIDWEITLPETANVGDFIQIDFVIKNAPVNVTFSSEAVILGVNDFSVELQKVYSVYLDWGIIGVDDMYYENEYGWRFNYISYDLAGE